MKKSNDTIWIRTGDLPACSPVPQPTVPTHSLLLICCRTYFPIKAATKELWSAGNFTNKSKFNLKNTPSNTITVSAEAGNWIVNTKKFYSEAVVVFGLVLFQLISTYVKNSGMSFVKKIKETKINHIPKPQMLITGKFLIRPSKKWEKHMPLFLLSVLIIYSNRQHTN
jgi:hypothetical protein